MCAEKDERTNTDSAQEEPMPKTILVKPARDLLDPREASKLARKLLPHRKEGKRKPRSRGKDQCSGQEFCENMVKAFIAFWEDEGTICWSPEAKAELEGAGLTPDDVMIDPGDAVPDDANHAIDRFFAYAEHVPERRLKKTLLARQRVFDLFAQLLGLNKDRK